MDIELLKEKRKEEMMVYEQILFGEKPERIYEMDSDNPKQFFRYKFDDRHKYEFGKFYLFYSHLIIFRTFNQEYTADAGWDETL